MSGTNAADEDERLLLRLRAIASPVRLQILRALVVPLRAADIRARASSERAGLGAERFVGRTTVIEHLAALEEAKLVRRVGETYVVDQQNMVAFIQQLGELARLRALVDVDVETTMSVAAPSAQPLPSYPRVLVASGPDAGRAVALDGAGPWRIGRSSDCEVALAHDPHVSRAHVTLRRASDGGFELDVAPNAKNPAYVDFALVPPGASSRLRGGALISVGATLLAIQP